MRPLIRWLLLLPAVAAGFAITAALYWPARQLLLHSCSNALRTVESTTDLSQRDYTGTAEGCSAGWYPTADASSLVVILLLSVVASGTIGYRLAPTHKRLASALSSVLAITVIAIAFFRDGS